ncbi:MAG: tetratricopeptide repeat protein [Candidatus Helarchaeota archaeon]
MKVYEELIKKGEYHELNNRYEQALSIYLNAEKIVKKYGSKIERGNLAFRKGKVLAKKGKLKDALDAFKTSLKFFKKGRGTALQIARIWEGMGDAYKINRKIENAMNAYQEALKILENEKERVVYTHSHLTTQILEAIALLLNKIGKTYRILKDLDSALEKCRESLKIALDTKKPPLILKIRSTISSILLEKEQANLALEYLMKSLDIVKKEKDPSYLLNLYREIANIYKIERNTKQALNYYRKGVKLAEKLNDKKNLTIILDEIGFLYLQGNKRKRALEFLEKSYDLAQSINQFHFDYILYHLGILYSLNKDHEKAYEYLMESLKFAKKNDNKGLLIEILVKIGDIWKDKQNYEDSIYYYKKALELTSDEEKKFELLNAIGVNYLLLTKLSKANDFFINLFNDLKIQILSESSVADKEKLLKKISEVSQNICIIKCLLYEKTGNISLLKEALGFSEFLALENMPLDLKNYISNLECPERNQYRMKIEENCSTLKKLIYQYKMEENFKNKLRLTNQIKEIKEIVLTLSDNLWGICNEPLESFPKSEEKFIERFFQCLTQNFDGWIILKFIYSAVLNKMFVFSINPKDKELKLFSKQITKKLVNSINSKLKQLRNLDYNKAKINLKLKIEKIYSSLKNLWNKLVPKPLTTYLLNKNFEYLTLIPHSFLWKLPWETMQIKNRALNELFKITRNFSIDYLRADLQRTQGNKTFILIKDFDTNEFKLLNLENLEKGILNEQLYDNIILKFLVSEIKKQINLSSVIQNIRVNLIKKKDLESNENIDLHLINSFILIGNPFSK